MPDHFPSIVEPQKYECQMWAYDPGLSRLYVRIHKGDFHKGEVAYLIFGSTHYFDGPLGWSGADFRLAPVAEVVELLNRINPVPPDYVLDDPTLGLTLYKIERAKFTVRILAASCGMHALGAEWRIIYPESTPH